MARLDAPTAAHAPSSAEVAVAQLERLRDARDALVVRDGQTPDDGRRRALLRVESDGASLLVRAVAATGSREADRDALDRAPVACTTPCVLERDAGEVYVVRAEAPGVPRVESWVPLARASARLRVRAGSDEYRAAGAAIAVAGAAALLGGVVAMVVATRNASSNVGGVVAASGCAVATRGTSCTSGGSPAPVAATLVGALLLSAVGGVALAGGLVTAARASSRVTTSRAASAVHLSAALTRDGVMATVGAQF